jgi:hypothetical protein
MKHRMPYGIGGAVVAVVVSLLFGVADTPMAAQGKVDVTGKWVFDVTTSGGSGTPTMMFKQDGENLTGTYEGQLGKANLKGTVKGQAINFSFTVDVQGQVAEVTYDGRVEKDSMKGTVDIGPGAASGSFTAKRQ